MPLAFKLILYKSIEWQDFVMKPCAYIDKYLCNVFTDVKATRGQKVTLLKEASRDDKKLLCTKSIKNGVTMFNIPRGSPAFAN